MKKSFSLLLSLSFLLLTAAPAYANTPASYDTYETSEAEEYDAEEYGWKVTTSVYQPVLGGMICYGDVDRDGYVTAADARKILRYSVGLDMPGMYQDQLLSDVNFDGRITALDARLTLRTSVGLEPLNVYYSSQPRAAGLISGKSLSLTKKGNTLYITASTIGTNAVTRCGFTYVKLHKKESGEWRDLDAYTYRNLYNDSNSKVFSKSVNAGKGTFRAVCEHFAEAPYLGVFTQSATAYNTSTAVKV